MNRRFLATRYETGEPTLEVILADSPECAWACCSLLGWCLEGELVPTPYDYPDEIKQAMLERLDHEVH